MATDIEILKRLVSQTQRLNRTVRTSTYLQCVYAYFIITVGTQLDKWTGLALLVHVAQLTLNGYVESLANEAALERLEGTIRQLIQGQEAINVDRVSNLIQQVLIIRGPLETRAKRTEMLNFCAEATCLWMMSHQQLGGELRRFKLKM